jgi:hypothetical protein
LYCFIGGASQYLLTAFNLDCIKVGGPPQILSTIFGKRPEAKTYIDKANLFEKLEIANAEDLKLMRDLRNEISHEYKLRDITELF